MDAEGAVFMKTTIQAIQSRPGQRILVTSDVHGHLGHLAELLRRAEYGGDDILVIVGDLIDKGPESLATLRYCRELAQEGDVYISLGNVDAGRLRRLADSGEGAGLRFLKLVRWLWEEWGCGLVLDMLAELGIPVSKLTEENAEEYRGLLCRHFAGEIAFLQGLPVILEMGKYIFVHGGIPTDELESLADCDGMEFLKNNAFMEKGYRFSRCVVVGHWPACLYNREYETAEPVFNRAQNIISMDGGCGLKRGGQLNMLILPDRDAEMGEIRWLSYDGLPSVVAGEDQAGSAPSIHIQYGDNEVEIVEERGSLAAYRQTGTGREFLAPADHFYTRDFEGGTKTWLHDYCDAGLEVRAGDVLGVIAQTEAGCYAKKDGRIGWYRGSFCRQKEALTWRLGRPQNEKGRRKRERAVYGLLDRLDIVYRQMDHAQVRTMEACEALDQALEAAICKNLFLCNAQKTRFYLLLMPGDKKFRTKDLSRQIHSARLSFAPPVYMEEYLGISPGAASPMGLMNDRDGRVTLLIDRDVLREGYLGCHPCVNTASIRLSMRDFWEVFLPAVGHEAVTVEL